MAFINYSLREISVKIVYYGPGLGGKTTNIQFIHQKSDPGTRGKLISLATETERTLYFDFLHFQLGEIKGFKTRLQLYTVPGQVFYDASRKLILKNVDGIIFVADSQVERIDANLESVDNMKFNLVENGLTIEQVPWVMQYNKRDLPSAMDLKELSRLLNFMNVPEFEAVASKGTGVFETLRTCGKLVLKDLKQKGNSI